MIASTFCAPRTSSPGHRLCCHGAVVTVQEVPRVILANRGFLVQFFKEGLSYGELSRMQEKRVFSCTGSVALRLTGGWLITP